MKKVLTVLMVLAMAGLAGAATVEVWVEGGGGGGGGGAYVVKARLAGASASDNGGISYAWVELSNVDTATCSLPQVLWGTGPGKAGGFVLLRSGEGSNPSLPIGGAQDSVGMVGGVCIYGLGIGDVDMAKQMPPGSYTYDPGQIIPRSMVVGGGTYTGAPPEITGAGFNVFAGIGDPDTFIPSVVIIPEPVTLSLLALGALALIRRRR